MSCTLKHSILFLQAVVFALMARSLLAFSPERGPAHRQNGIHRPSFIWLPTTCTASCCSARIQQQLSLLASTADSSSFNSREELTSNPSSDKLDDNDDDDDREASGFLLESCLIPMDSCKVKRMSSTDLAYIGDAVYELFIRSKYVWPSRRTKDLQKAVVSLVRAEFQAELLAKIRASESGFVLTSSEQAILSRGRNAVGGSKNRRSDPAAYQDATALEALIGYLYIDDRARCAELLEFIKPHLPSEQ